MENNIEESIKKKRGRRKKTEIVENESPVVETNNVTITMEPPTDSTSAKKRGRKPKGGKLILKQQELENKQNTIANVILHLKCSLNDLNEYNTQVNKLMTNELIYNPEIPPEVKTYNSETGFTTYELNTQQNSDPNYAYSNQITRQTNMPLSINTNTNYVSNVPVSNICQLCSENMNEQDDTENENNEVNMKDINGKLKKLKINLYKNTLQDKKSACFWCTYEYDNPPCYIPKYEMDEKIFGYGSFCRPECAVAYLMKESLDDSTKFERYHLLNQIYSKVYEYKQNIKPAPNPHYLLDKFYGNLSIQEYRKLLKTEHLLLVIDKPMTRVLPELFEDNDNFILGIYGGAGTKNAQPTSNSIYKVKRQSEKQQGPSKNSIMRDTFGLSKNE